MPILWRIDETRILNQRRGHILVQNCAEISVHGGIHCTISENVAVEVSTSISLPMWKM